MFEQSVSKEFDLTAGFSALFLRLFQGIFDSNIIILFRIFCDITYCQYKLDLTCIVISKMMNTSRKWQVKKPTFWTFFCSNKTFSFTKNSLFAILFIFIFFANQIICISEHNCVFPAQHSTFICYECEILLTKSVEAVSQSESVKASRIRHRPLSQVCLQTLLKVNLKLWWLNF